jgi:hypothetical protein
LSRVDAGAQAEAHQRWELQHGQQLVGEQLHRQQLPGLRQRGQEQGVRGVKLRVLVHAAQHVVGILLQE